MKIRKIKYDEPIEIIESKYDLIIRKLSGIIAHRIDDQGKFWIKLWITSGRRQLKKLLK